MSEETSNEKHELAGAPMLPVHVQVHVVASDLGGYVVEVRNSRTNEIVPFVGDIPAGLHADNMLELTMLMTHVVNTIKEAFKQEQEVVQNAESKA